MTSSIDIHKRLIAIAETSGIPMASPQIDDIPEECPHGFAYLLHMMPYFATDLTDAPTFHRTLDEAKRMSWQADIMAHHRCKDPYTSEPLDIYTALRSADYRKGIFAPQGCGNADANGQPCIYPRTNPHLFVVRWDAVIGGNGEGKIQRLATLPSRLEMIGANALMN